jgi:hypothetical protein
MVLYQKYTMDRMAGIYGVAAQVFAVSDPKKAGEFLTKQMDALFPEVAKGKENDVASKLEELKKFSDKIVMLVPTHGGFSLKMEDKKPKGEK